MLCLGWTAGTVTITFRNKLGTISQCLERYPHISSLVANPYETSGNLAIALRAVKDHAVELAREVALQQLRQAQSESDEAEPLAAKKCKKRGTRLLHKVAPGKGGAVGAIQDDRGRSLTELNLKRWQTFCGSTGQKFSRPGESIRIGCSLG